MNGGFLELRRPEGRGLWSFVLPIFIDHEQEGGQFLMLPINQNKSDLFFYFHIIGYVM